MASGNDMNQARETFAGFTQMMKWGTIISVLVAAFVVFLIA